MRKKQADSREKMVKEMEESMKDGEFRGAVQQFVRATTS